MAPETFSDGLPLPKVLVFDLDYTLWPFWCDTHVSPPIRAKDGGKAVVDSTGEKLAFYEDVPSIIASARKKSINLSLASRTHAPKIAESLLKMLTVECETNSNESVSTKAFDYFEHRQIYPGDKQTHLKRIRSAASVPYEDILFFDDESRNRNVESLGVYFWLVRDGVSSAELDKGIRAWRQKRRSKAD